MTVCLPFFQSQKCEACGLFKFQILYLSIYFYNNTNTVQMFTENSPYRGFLVSFYMQAQGQHYAGLDIPQWRLTYMFDKLVNALDE